MGSEMCIRDSLEMDELLKLIHGESWVVEAVVDYRLEMSVIIVSDGLGKLVAYPLLKIPTKVAYYV